MQYIVPKTVLLVMSATVNPCSSLKVTVTLADKDIPGAKLQEPFENMPFQPYNGYFCVGVLKHLPTGARPS